MIHWMSPVWEAVLPVDKSGRVYVVGSVPLLHAEVDRSRLGSDGRSARATWLISVTGSPVSPSAILIVTGLTVIAAATLHETGRT